MTQVDGWFTEDEAKLLAAAANHQRFLGHFVEVGVYKGRSAAILADKWTDTDHLLYLIDNMSLDGADSSTWPAGERIIQIQNGEMPDIGDVALLHHDADHTFDVVRAHLQYWLPRMAQRGLIALHDFIKCPTSEVPQAWAEARGKSRLASKSWGQADSLQVFEVWQP